MLVLLILVFGFGLVIFVLSRTSTTIVVERGFDASPEKVWYHWNDVESIKKWWSPKHFTAPVVQSDLRVGGKFLLAMQDPNGKISYNSGTYKEIIPNQKIVSEFSFSDENGNLIPGDKVEVPGKWPDSVTVTVEFQDISGKTNIKVTEEGIPTIMYFFAKMGWQQQFEKLENVIQ